MLTLVVTAAAATYLGLNVRSQGSSALVVGVIGVACTYAAPVAGHHGGPVSAGVMGLALLGLAHVAHTEARIYRRLPRQTLAWTGRTTAAVVAGSAVLDALAALVSAGGAPRPGETSAVGVLAVCLAVTALVATVLALAEGGGRLVLRRRTVPVELPEDGRDPDAL